MEVIVEFLPVAAVEHVMGGMGERLECVIVGAGQAGLATSRELARAGVEHVVLERGRVADTWRGRWESFCLVSPNWSLQLPDGAYEGDDPDGFLLRDEIVAHLERYAARIEAPVREGVEVTSVRPRADGTGFALDTSDGPIEARSVVVASGAYQRAHRPAPLAALPAELPQVDVAGYRSPDASARRSGAGGGQRTVGSADRRRPPRRRARRVPRLRTRALAAALDR